MVWTQGYREVSLEENRITYTMFLQGFVGVLLTLVMVIQRSQQNLPLERGPVESNNPNNLPIRWSNAPRHAENSNRGSQNPGDINAAIERAQPQHSGVLATELPNHHIRLISGIDYPALRARINGALDNLDTITGLYVSNFNQVNLNRGPDINPLQCRRQFAHLNDTMKKFNIHSRLQTTYCHLASNQTHLYTATVRHRPLIQRFQSQLSDMACTIMPRCNPLLTCANEIIPSSEFTSVRHDYQDILLQTHYLLWCLHGGRQS